MKNKVYIIGWDGATWNILRKFIEKGIMPNLKKMLLASTSGVLNSSYPPVTPPAWATFLTGKNPAKHNVFEFFKFDRTFSSLEINDSNSIKSKIIWEYLSYRGYKHILSGIPLSYPFRKINGIYIGDFLTPSEKILSNNEDVIKNIEQRFGSYKIYPSEVFYPGNEERILIEAIDHLEYHLKVQEFLSLEYDWDVFFYYYNISDRLQHEIWHLLDENHLFYDEKLFKKHKDLIYTFYNLLDKSLEIYNKYFKDYNLVLLSDHGFGPVNYTLSINAFLLDNGYLKVKEALYSRVKYLLFKTGFTPLNMYNLLSFFKLGKIRLKRYRKDINRNFIERLSKAIFFNFSDIDWEQSYAFSRGNMGQIYYNTKKMTEDIKIKLKEDLFNIKDVRGEKLVKKVFEKEELYNGPFMDNAPDLYIKLNDESYNLNAPVDFIQNKVVKGLSKYSMSGAHRLEGIYLLKGNDIKENNLVDANIMDLAPTILYLMDSYFQPNNFDGNIIKKALINFTEDKFINKNLDTQDLENIEVDENSKDKKIIYNRLKELGYF